MSEEELFGGEDLVFDPDILSMVERFHNPGQVVDHLREKRHYFEFDIEQMVSMYGNLTRNIQEGSNGNGRSLSLVQGVVVLWDFNFAKYLLKEDAGIPETEIDVLVEEEVIKRGLEYAQENRFGYIERIMDARDRTLEVISEHYPN